MLDEVVDDGLRAIRQTLLKKDPEFVKRITHEKGYLTEDEFAFILSRCILGSKCIDIYGLDPEIDHSLLRYFRIKFESDNIKYPPTTKMLVSNQDRDSPLVKLASRYHSVKIKYTDKKIIRPFKVLDLLWYEEVRLDRINSAGQISRRIIPDTVSCLAALAIFNAKYLFARSH